MLYSTKNYKELTDAASSLWRIVKHRNTYGQTCYVIGEQGVVLTFEQAMEDALARVEAALVKAGGELNMSPDRN